MSDERTTGTPYTIVVTRTAEQCAPMIDSIVSAGHHGLALPLIAVKPCALSSDSDRTALADLRAGRYDWLVLESANGVRTLAACLSDSPLPPSTKIAVQGSVTAAAVDELFGRSADLLPSHFVAEDLLVEILTAIDPRTRPRVCVAGAAEGRRVVATGLAQWGLPVTELAVYSTERVSPAPAEIAEFFALNPQRTVLTFCSPSAVESFHRFIAPQYHPAAFPHIGSIGPISSAALGALGYPLSIEAQSYTAEGLLTAVFDYLHARA